MSTLRRGLRQIQYRPELINGCLTGTGLPRRHHAHKVSNWARLTTAGSTSASWKEELPLTRERIVRAPSPARRAGDGARTMRHLAERLQPYATTLYWHMATKADVIDLAVDAIFRETSLPDQRAENPRDDIVALANTWRQAMLWHPWAATLLARQRPLMGPNFLAWNGFLQFALLRTGLTWRAARPVPYRRREQLHLRRRLGHRPSTPGSCPLRSESGKGEGTNTLAPCWLPPKSNTPI